MTDEKEFYADLRDNYKQQEKAINDWTEFVARTSNYQVLRVAKEKQEQSVDASRISVKQKPGLVVVHTDNSLDQVGRVYDTSTVHFRTVVHKYEQPGLSTTVYRGRAMLIESTPLQLTGGKLKDYEPDTGTIRAKTVIIE